jgi:multidrug efflux pump
VRTTHGYTRLIAGALRLCVIMLMLYGGLLALTYWEFGQTKRGFIPQQDMGYLMVNVQLPDSASMERTDGVMRQIEKIALSVPGIRHVTCISGTSFVLNASGSNFGSCFINLKNYPDRRDPDLSSDAIANKLRQRFGKEILEANVAVFGPPPVRGVGRAGGFAMMVEDRGDFGPAGLQKQTDNLVRLGNEKPGLIGLFSVFRANVPQIRLDADTGVTSMRSVNLRDLTQTLEVYEGSLYVNDFNLFGRTWQVIVQAEANFRSRPEDLYALRTRNARNGKMVPLGSLGDQRPINGPLVLTRYNMYPAAAINGTAAPGMSSGQVIDVLKNLANQELPRGMAYEWTDMSYLELLAGNTAMMIFAFAVVMVFLVLAAQYESWSLPMAVILVVPTCILSAVIGVNIAGMDINIFTQIGFVVLVGLASKNAILIVEFAKVQRHEGKSRREATLEACKLRLRPIVMTSLAFILGVIPLIISQGAGAEMRRTLGTAVFSGMLGVTVFGLILTPVFFFTVDWLGDSRLFASKWMRRLGTLGLDIVTLRSVRHAAVSATRRLVSARRLQPSPQLNGQSLPPRPEREAPLPRERQPVEPAEPRRG